MSTAESTPRSPRVAELLQAEAAYLRTWAARLENAASSAALEAALESAGFKLAASCGGCGDSAGHEAVKAALVALGWSDLSSLRIVSH